MEIPGRLHSLNFSDRKRAKLIMCVGEAAGPNISTHINLAYGLVNFNLKEDGSWDNEKNIHIFDSLEQSVNEEKLYNLRFKKFKYWQKISKKEKLGKYRRSIENHNLWTYFSDLFGEYFEFIIDNLYITDLSKCNAKGNKKWRDCHQNCVHFLFEEVKAITPLLIIFLGRSSYTNFCKLLRKKNIQTSNGTLDGEEVNMASFYKDFDKLKIFSYFTINDLPIYLINIYHNKWLTDYRNEEKKKQVLLFKKQSKEFMRNVVLPLINNVL